MAADGISEVDHTADWALDVRGIDFADLLAQAAGGMLSLAGAVPAAGTQPGRRRVRLECPDRETLLVRWLEEILFLLESEGKVPREMHLRIGGGFRLEARLAMSAAAGRPRAIKAVTFHALQVEDHPGGVRARLVFDV